MSVECIHGLEAGLCDQCYPKPVLEKPLAARAAPRARAVPRRTMAMTAEKPAVVDTGAKRIFHLTHMNNLAAILKGGKLLSDAAGAKPAVDISSADNREQRRALGIPSGAAVADYVPFFLAPNADVWDGMRAKTPDDRLSDDIFNAPAADFVMLVSTVRAAGKGTVVTDGDAMDPRTHFTVRGEPDERMPSVLEEESAELSAEFLVKKSFPFESVTLIGVANDKARREVRAILQVSKFSPKIAVYPPWFQRPD